MLVKLLVILIMSLGVSPIMAQSPSGDAVSSSQPANRTQLQYIQHYAWKEAHYQSQLKQPDAQIVELGEKGQVKIFHSEHCMQAALMDNKLIVPVPCGHYPGEYLHALTTNDGLVVTGYITSKEYKAWINNPKGE